MIGTAFSGITGDGGIWVCSDFDLSGASKNKSFSKFSKSFCFFLGEGGDLSGFRRFVRLTPLSSIRMYIVFDALLAKRMHPF